MSKPWEELVVKKLDDLGEQVKDNTERMGEYNTQLAVHIEKTEQLKRYVDIVYDETKCVTKRIEPLEDSKKFYSKLSKGIIAVLGLTGTVLGAVYVFTRLL